MVGRGMVQPVVGGPKRKYRYAGSGPRQRGGRRRRRRQRGRGRGGMPKFLKPWAGRFVHNMAPMAVPLIRGLAQEMFNR